MATSDKILFVDDEVYVLEGIKRKIGRKYNLTTATSGFEGITAFEEQGPFSLVVSDMRMPEMDGVKFLSTVKKLYPDTVRVMLTGNAELETAKDAVNQGNIFRFINKPCPPETMEEVIEDSLRQYHLQIAEQDLLKNTLKGSVKVLIDILSLTNPLAFSKASRLKFYAKQFAIHLQIRDLWQLELAALFSQLGCVTIPSDILTKMYKNQPLSEREKEIALKYPVISHDLLINIPRLENIAIMIKHMYHDYREKASGTNELVKIGSEILHVAHDFDTLISCGLSRESAISELFKSAGILYNPAILEILDRIALPNFMKKTYLIKISELEDEMIIEEDIMTKNGLLLVPKGHKINTTVKMFLTNHFQEGNIASSVQVSLAVADRK